MEGSCRMELSSGDRAGYAYADEKTEMKKNRDPMTEDTVRSMPAAGPPLPGNGPGTGGFSGGDLARARRPPPRK